MSIVVETGTGNPTSESYVSVATADTYHSARGNAAWAALAVAAKEAALRQATDYMLQVYRGNWKGFRAVALQALDWPRQSVLKHDGVLNEYVSYNSVPLEVQFACASLALRAATQTLNPDIEQGKVSETVGQISVSYDIHATRRPQYLEIDGMLRQYLRTSAAMVRMARG